MAANQINRLLLVIIVAMPILLCSAQSSISNTAQSEIMSNNDVFAVYNTAASFGTHANDADNDAPTGSEDVLSLNASEEIGNSVDKLAPVCNWTPSSPKVIVRFVFLTVLTTILTVIGLVGNGAAFVFLCRERGKVTKCRGSANGCAPTKGSLGGKNSAMNLLLWTLSGLNCLQLIYSFLSGVNLSLYQATGAFPWLMWQHQWFTHVKILAPLGTSIHMAVTYTVVFIAVERFFMIVSVGMPRTELSRKRHCIAVGTMLVLCIVYNIPIRYFILDADLIRDPCTGYTVYKWYTTPFGDTPLMKFGYLTTVYALVMYVVPFGVIVGAYVRISCVLETVRVKFNELNKDPEAMKTRERKLARINRLTLAIVLSFLVVMALDIVANVIVFVFPSQVTALETIIVVSHFSLTLRSVSDFVLYSVFRSNFRQSLKRQFTCRCSKDKSDDVDVTRDGSS